MATRDRHEALKEVLRKYNYRQTWTLCVQALRAMRSKGDKRSTVRWALGTLEHELYPLMCEPLDIDHRSLANLSSVLPEDDGANVLEFLLWLERAGLAYHLGRGSAGNYVEWIRFLPAGLKFFDATTDESPYAHDWTARMQKQCAGLTDEIISLLDDARACFDRRLLRPAVALLGVAFEASFAEVHDALVSTYGVKMTPAKPQKANEYIAAVRSAIATRIPPGPAYKDQCAAAESACDFADDLRRRRNDASHPGGKPIVDADEVDELFLQAGRKLPHLWQLH